MTRPFIIFAVPLLLLTITLKLFAGAPASATQDPSVVRDGEYLWGHLLWEDLLSGQLDEHGIPESTAAWQPLRLPHYWRSKTVQATSGWYRFTLHQDQAPTGLWGVYLPRFSMNAKVYVNRQLIGSGGSMEEPIARNWNRPLYFTVPENVWRQGQNEIHILMASYPGYGFLQPIEVGQDSKLRPRYEKRKILQVYLAQVIFSLCLLTGLFVYFMWLQKKEDHQYLWFCGSVLALSVFMLNQFVRDIPVAASTWWILVHSGIHFWEYCLCLFMLRNVGINKKSFERFWLAYFLIFFFVYFFLDYYEFFVVSIFAHLGGYLMMIQSAWFLWSNWQKNGDSTSHLYIAVIGVICLFGFHDTLTQTNSFPASWSYDYYALNFGIPILSIALAGHLILQFARSIKNSESLNIELENRVESAKKVIEDNFRKIETIGREQSILQERERIYQDLHDDVGAKLLALIYRSKDRENADLARSALQDMRDIVSHTESDKIMLDEMVTNWHLETENRLADLDITIRWDAPGSLSEIEVSEFCRTHLTRILREAVSNIIKHASASYAAIKICYETDFLRVSITNDGSMKPVVEWQRGRGLNNISIRCTELGGQARWQQLSQNEVQVEWTVPYEKLTL